MDFFEKQSYSLTSGMADAIKVFTETYPTVYDNPSHFVRCAIIKQFREERKKGRYISEPI